jgi:Lrp/AsnC family transcriptional regulator
VTLLDRKKIGLNTQIFAEVKLNAHGRSNFTEFTEAIRGFPEVLECYVLMGRWISVADRRGGHRGV